MNTHWGLGPTLYTENIKMKKSGFPIQSFEKEIKQVNKPLQSNVVQS